MGLLYQTLLGISLYDFDIAVEFSLEVIRRITLNNLDVSNLNQAYYLCKTIGQTKDDLLSEFLNLHNKNGREYRQIITQKIGAASDDKSFDQKEYEFLKDFDKIVKSH